MTDAEIDARTLKAIGNHVARDQVPEGGLGADTALADIGFESLELVETVMALEDEFNIVVEDDTVNDGDFVTIGDVQRMVRATVRAAG